MTVEQEKIKKEIAIWKGIAVGFVVFWCLCLIPLGIKIYSVHKNERPLIQYCINEISTYYEPEEIGFAYTWQEAKIIDGWKDDRGFVHTFIVELYNDYDNWIDTWFVAMVTKYSSTWKHEPKEIYEIDCDFIKREII